MRHVGWYLLIALAQWLLCPFIFERLPLHQAITYACCALIWTWMNATAFHENMKRFRPRSWRWGSGFWSERWEWLWFCLFPSAGAGVDYCCALNTLERMMLHAQREERSGPYQGCLVLRKDERGFMLAAQLLVDSERLRYVGDSPDQRLAVFTWRR